MTGEWRRDARQIREDLAVSRNFDLVERQITVGGREASFYFVDGFCKEAVVQKLLEYLLDLKPSDLRGIRKAEDFLKIVPYNEAAAAEDYKTGEEQVLAGQLLLLIDGVVGGILVDVREYPTRGIVEPDKDRSLRGSRDSFCETLTFNTALLRRRIRDPRLRCEYAQVGSLSKTDLCLCYLDGAVDQKELTRLRARLKKLDLKSVSMTSEAVAEVLVPTRFLNPLPRIKYTERPDYAAACVMEGRIALILDNCPSVMLFATNFSDFTREADDYYFPPLTATYVRLTRFIVSLFTVFLTPTVLMFNLRPEWIPDWLSFIHPAGEVTMPLIAQFLILEFVIDGLKLASVNTPSTMSNSLGIIGGLLLSDFAVTAGWFVPDTIVYISFVAIATYAQPSLEMGYAMKFARVILLFLVQFFSVWGLIGGTVGIIVLFLCTKTLSGYRYFYPVIPFNAKDFAALFVRKRVANGGEEK